MFIHWSGRGWIVAAAFVGCLVVTQLLVGWISGDERYYQKHGWPRSAALLAAAIIVWVAGRKYNAPPEPRDDAAALGYTVRPVHRRRHTFFFIPLEYWAPVLAGASLFAALTW